MLVRNTKNRLLSQARCDKYASAITRGEWQLNGDAIRFSIDGMLLDGQHRLHAIIKSGVSIESLVIYDLDESTFTTIDQGAKRTSSDVLSLKNYKNTNTLAAAALLLYRYELNGSPFSGSYRKSPSTEQIIGIIEKNPNLEHYVSICVNSKIMKSLMAPSYMSFCYFVFSKHDLEKAEEFFSFIKSPTNEVNAASIMRERLIQEKIKKQKPDQQYMTKLMFKSFRYFIKGITTKILKVTETGESEEKDAFNLLR